MPKKPVSDADDAIRALAHQMWEEEGRPEGMAEIHWHRAAQALAEPVIKPTAGNPAKKPASKAATSTAKTKTSKPKAR